MNKNGKPYKNEKGHIVRSILFSQELYNQIQFLAEQNNVTISHQIRNLIQEQLNANTSQPSKR